MKTVFISNIKKEGIELGFFFVFYFFMKPFLQLNS